MSESNNNLNKNQVGNAYQRPVANIFDLYLTGAITDAKDYQDWLKTRTENDMPSQVFFEYNYKCGNGQTILQVDLSNCGAVTPEPVMQYTCSPL